jgi:hypothetical protein
MRLIKFASVLFANTLLLACQSNWYESPDFGNSVNGAITSQAVNPNAPIGNKTPTKGLDGPAAKAGVDNYQRSYESRATTGGYPGGGVLTPSSSSASGMNTMGTSTK